ncbi:hypothetical protein E5S67_04098 [Microcoleus sp. IPMA8]|uniref:Transposase n=2 Tax=Microcoleus TaxID=44471 RepID=A0ABX2D158_9CYAN|nr:hypothetical protein [Microcoleus asticus IPMA8]
MKLIALYKLSATTDTNTANSMYMWYTLLSTSAEKMKAYSIEFRKKIVKAYEQGDTSVRKVAQRFEVSKAFVQKI